MNRHEPVYRRENSNWYPRIAASNNAATIEGDVPERESLTRIARRQLGHRAPPGAAEILLELAQRGVEQLAAGDDDQVDAFACQERRIEPEHFSNQAFSAISSNGVTQFARCDDPKSGGVPRSLGNEQCEIPRRHAQSGLENLLEFCLSPHALRLAETMRRHAPARL